MEDAGGNLLVAVGLAGQAVAAELALVLWRKGILSDDDMLMVMTGAIDALRQGNEAQPNPAWGGAQNLLRLRAEQFGGPAFGTKPS